MPRDPSGNYTLPAGNPVVSGTTIDSSWANNTMNDLANEMTNSLSRNGNGGMNVPLLFSDGSESAPGITFTAEPTTGIYRANSGQLGITTQTSKMAIFDGPAGEVSISANLRVENDTALLNATISNDLTVQGQLNADADLTVAGNTQLAGAAATQVSLSDAAATPQEAVRKNELDEEIDTLNDKLADISLLTVPIGTILPFSSTNIPVGYLLCDGAAIDPQYTDLIALIGANTPDLRGQFMRGWSPDSAGPDPDRPRAPLTSQADAFESHTHNTEVQQVSFTTWGGNGRGGTVVGGLAGVTSAVGGPETRPVNVTVVFIIKT